MLYKNILLIDDDQEDAELFMEAAASLNKGVVIQWKINALSALEELEISENLPDLIFLDYNMPRINGLEMLMSLKSSKKLKDIPVIMISTPSEAFVKELLNNKHLLKYISKPNSYIELINVLDSIL